MAKIVVFLSALILSGCEGCPVKFQDGSFVRHKLTGDRFLVMDSAHIKNYQGYCLVTIRREDGGLTNVSSAEIE